jgi:hypothetical protein
VLSTRKIVIGRQKLGCHFSLRRQVLTAVYCCGAGVRELQGSILHEMIPTLIFDKDRARWEVQVKRAPPSRELLGPGAQAVPN